MIYFIRSLTNSLIKIGFTSKHPAKRLQGIQAMSPVPLEPIGVMHGRRTDEKGLHAMFFGSSSHGEWFRPDSPVLEFIDGSAMPWPAMDARPAKDSDLDRLERYRNFKAWAIAMLGEEEREAAGIVKPRLSQGWARDKNHRENELMRKSYSELLARVEQQAETIKRLSRCLAIIGVDEKELDSVTQSDIAGIRNREYKRRMDMDEPIIRKNERTRVWDQIAAREAAEKRANDARLSEESTAKPSPADSDTPS